ncbi:MAG: hypothetical protein JWL95_3227 [Gemmatimonadetes bacterium]|nr:hypothetical protein [Gemmatimonadota bacterium]
MSTPQRPLLPDSGGKCCDGAHTFPGWWRYYRLGPKSMAEQEAECRARAIANWDNPDRIWCTGCSTFLEDFRDNFAEAAPSFLRMVATAASLIPGFGTIAADILGTVAALADGESLSDALVSGVMSAIPGGPAWQGAAQASRALIQGERVDRALVAGARAAIAETGGPLAAAAFDGVLALAQGKQIQDAGFSALKALAKGNDLAERAANFSEVVTKAAEEGRSVADVLVTELANDVWAAAGPGAATLVGSVVKRLQIDPSLLDVGSTTLAQLAGVSEPVARAAQAIMRNGSPDPALQHALTVDRRVVVHTAAGDERMAQAASQVVLRDFSRIKVASSLVGNANIARAVSVAQLAKPAPPVALVVAPPAPPVKVAAPPPATSPAIGLAPALLLAGSAAAVVVAVAWAVKSS